MPDTQFSRANQHTETQTEQTKTQNKNHHSEFEWQVNIDLGGSSTIDWRKVEARGEAKRHATARRRSFFVTGYKYKGGTYRVMLCHRTQVSREWRVEVRAGGWSFFTSRRSLSHGAAVRAWWRHIKHLSCLFSSPLLSPLLCVRHWPSSRQ